MIIQPVGWAPIAKLIGQPELAEDPEWATPQARLDKLDKAFSLIEEWSIQKPKWEVLAELNAHNIPCGPILSTKEIIEDPTLRENGVIATVEHPERGTYNTVGSPIRLSDSPVDVDRSPLLGEHNADLYGAELGLSDDDLNELKSNGVI